MKIVYFLLSTLFLNETYSFGSYAFVTRSEWLLILIVAGASTIPSALDCWIMVHYIRFSHLVCYDPRMNNILIENTNLCLPKVNHALGLRVTMGERYIGTIKFFNWKCQSFLQCMFFSLNRSCNFFKTWYLLWLVHG